MSQLSSNLKYLRQEKKLSQQKVADKIGITQRQYCFYESGRSEPNISVLTALADFFNKTIDDLVRKSLWVLVPDKEDQQILYDKADRNHESIKFTLGKAIYDSINVAINNALGEDSSKIFKDYKPPIDETKRLTAGADEPPPTE
jgi:transcriptional regulator with XRE-family HTH domain